MYSASVKVEKKLKDGTLLYRAIRLGYGETPDLAVKDLRVEVDAHHEQALGKPHVVKAVTPLDVNVKESS